MRGGRKIPLLSLLAAETRDPGVRTRELCAAHVGGNHAQERDVGPRSTVTFGVVGGLIAVSLVGIT